MRWSSRKFLGSAATVAIGLSLAVPARAAMAATAATTTTVQSNVPSSTYDSPVTFTAQVTAPAGTPTGSVIFTDISNGSILATKKVLSNGVASFTTAALAPGARRVQAHYAGDASFSPSFSAPMDIPVANGASSSLAYQVDARHDGNQPVGKLTPSSLTKKWSVTLGDRNIQGTGNVSYPVIAAGRVFVTVPNIVSTGSTLYALKARTGEVDWSAGLGNHSTVVYDGRRLFALDGAGVLTSFVASTGHQLWSKPMPSQYIFNAQPTAYDGVVYVSGAGSGGTMFAVGELDGAVRWTASTVTGDISSPAVDYTGAYVSYDCHNDYRINLRGQQMWHSSGSCVGGIGSTAALHGNSVYARGGGAVLETALILSKSSGTSTGSFLSDTVPAFDKSNMYTLQSRNLVAVDPSGSPNRWTFTNGSIVTPPIANAGVVYVESLTGTVYGISAQTGRQVWTGSAGATSSGAGLAIGGGLLVVPAGENLTAFG